MTHAYATPTRSIPTKKIIVNHETDTTFVLRRIDSDRSFTHLPVETTTISGKLYAVSKLQGTYYPLTTKPEGFTVWLAENHKALNSRGLYIGKFEAGDLWYNGKEIVRNNPLNITCEKQDLMTELAYEAFILKRQGLLSNEDISFLATQYFNNGLVSNVNDFIKKVEKVGEIMQSVNLV
ncbi:hypothetical protein KO465_05050 [Candidatus Micrarchaeota archaeon]|nr:hypothetical protein [Candidatus Micrarchaeota archaeon]